MRAYPATTSHHYISSWNVGAMPGRASEDGFALPNYANIMSDLRTRMGISSTEYVIRYNCLRWFGHVQRTDEEKWPKKILK